MGSLVAISCSHCSYTEELALGVGFDGVEGEPMICDACDRIVVVPIGAARARGLISGAPVRLGLCPGCGGEELRHAEVDGRVGGAHPEDTKELCPSCGCGTLHAQSIGIWD